MSHWIWNNGLNGPHWPGRPVLPIFPFPLRHPAYPHPSLFTGNFCDFRASDGEVDNLSPLENQQLLASSLSLSLPLSLSLSSHGFMAVYGASLSLSSSSSSERSFERRGAVCLTRGRCDGGGDSYAHFPKHLTVSRPKEWNSGAVVDCCFISLEFGGRKTSVTLWAVDAVYCGTIAELFEPSYVCPASAHVQMSLCLPYVTWLEGMRVYECDTWWLKISTNLCQQQFNASWQILSTLILPVD